MRHIFYFLLRLFHVDFDKFSFIPKWANQVVQVVKNPLANAGDVGSIPELGRSPIVGNGIPLQYSCLENPMDREEPGGLQSTGLQRVRHD